MKQYTDKQAIDVIKEKLGYQERIVYCKDCVNSIPNPDRTDRSLTLMCTKIEMIHFATGKMKTCSRSVQGSNEPTEEPPIEDPDN